MSASVTVEFLEHHAVVEAEDERVTEEITRCFQWMLASGPARSRERLHHLRSGEDHALTRDAVHVYRDGSLREVQRVLRHEIIVGFIRARPELLWLHAGAAVLHDTAVLFVGPFGRGKSTLIGELCARGWRYASDDIVPLTVPEGRALPFPLTPAVREDVGRDLPRERIPEIRKHRISLPPALVHRDPLPIGAIVLPRYEAGAGAREEAYSPAGVVLDLLREAINAPLHERTAVALCSELVARVPVLPVVFSDAHQAVDLVADRLTSV